MSGAPELRRDDVALLRDYADELQATGDSLQVALGALVRSCTSWHGALRPHTAGTLVALVERLRERITGSTRQYGGPLAAKDLFELPIGGRFIVYWAKDNDAVNNLRLDYVEQVIQGFDEHGSILTNDGYEWQKQEITGPNSNVLDTGRGYAFFYRVLA